MVTNSSFAVKDTSKARMFLSLLFLDRMKHTKGIKIYTLGKENCDSLCLQMTLSAINKIQKNHQIKSQENFLWIWETYFWGAYINVLEELTQYHTQPRLGSDASQLKDYYVMITGMGCWWGDTWVSRTEEWAPKIQQCEQLWQILLKEWYQKYYLCSKKHKNLIPFTKITQIGSDLNQCETVFILV